QYSADRGAAGRVDGRDGAADPARRCRRCGRDRGRGTLPRLGGRLVHHGRRAAGRRRIGDVTVERRRGVITGLGMVSPLGNDVQTSWSRLLAGESGAAEITEFDHTDYNVHFACELKDFDPTVWVDRKASRRMDRFAQMILAAARQAESDSGVDVSK